MNMRIKKTVPVSTTDGPMIPAVYVDWAAETGNRQRRCHFNVVISSLVSEDCNISPVSNCHSKVSITSTKPHNLDVGTVQT